MKCTDKSFIINTTILHIKIRLVKFDVMPTLNIYFLYIQKIGVGKIFQVSYAHHTKIQ